MCASVVAVCASSSLCVLLLSLCVILLSLCVLLLSLCVILLSLLLLAFDCQVECAESVARQGVSATLQHHRPRSEVLHHLGHDRLEDALVALVVHAVMQREVERIVEAGPDTQILRTHRERYKETKTEASERDKEEERRRKKKKRWVQNPSCEREKGLA